MTIMILMVTEILVLLPSAKNCREVLLGGCLHPQFVRIVLKFTNLILLLIYFTCFPHSSILHSKEAINGQRFKSITLYKSIIITKEIICDLTLPYSIIYICRIIRIAMYDLICYVISSKYEHIW